VYPASSYAVPAGWDAPCAETAYADVSWFPEAECLAYAQAHDVEDGPVWGGLVRRLLRRIDTAA
jgi:hypothetical protein